MDAFKIFFLFLLVKSCESKSLSIKHYVEKLNNDYGYLRSTLSEMSWDAVVNMSQQTHHYITQIQEEEGKLERIACNYMTMLFNHDCFQDLKRQTYLFCRGPKYTAKELRMSHLYYQDIEMPYVYDEVCIASGENIPTKDLKKVEAAILDYLTDVKRALGLNNYEDAVLFAIKLGFSSSINNKGNIMCLQVKNELKEIMSYSTNEPVLKWAWLTSRENMSRTKEAFIEFYDILNLAAKRSGYRDYGAVWRESLEMPYVRIMVQKLYAQIENLYLLMHGVLRFHLREIYGDIVPEKGSIPAHLLGSLTGTDWRAWVDRLLPQNIRIEENIRKKNWTILHMTALVEDMYYSLGLHPMPEKFWKKSIFERGNNSHLDCFGFAVDMFKNDDDFRILYCAGDDDDFHVLHHELGHIEYFMSYSHQPMIYRSANPAFHESIGDAVLLGALTPQHLNRLGIINDDQLFGNSELLDGAGSSTIGTTDTIQTNDNVYEKTNHCNDEATTIRNVDANKYIDKDQDKLTSNKQSSEDTENVNENSKEKINDISSKIHTKLFEGEELTIDTIILIQSAFVKLPTMILDLALDEFRWLYFEGSLSNLNSDYWEIVRMWLGIQPPVERGEEYLDALAVNYVNHNIPTISYFLSGFLQHQLFEKMCIASVYGHATSKTKLPETMKLTRCDIYGSKAAGKVLMQLMASGNSKHWKELLKSATGEDDITADAFNRYYEPLHDLLERHVIKHKIPIGW